MSTRTFYLLATSIPDLERLVKQLPHVAVYPFYAEFSYALKDIAFNISKYPRNHFDRVCWVVPPGEDVKVNYLHEVAMLPEPFFRFILDALSVHMKEGGTVDVVEASEAEIFQTSTTLQLVVGEWKPIAKTKFDSQYGWEFEKRKTLVPTPEVVTSQTKHVTKVVWQANESDEEGPRKVLDEPSVDLHPDPEVGVSHEISIGSNTAKETSTSDDDATGTVEVTLQPHNAKKRRAKFHKVRRSTQFDLCRELDDCNYSH